MNIPPVTSDAVSAAFKNRTVPARPNVPEPPADVVDTSTRSSLVNAVANEAALRPEVVERARKLAGDPNYPSENLLGRLAEYLVKESTGQL
jgi:hypothetical protein